MNLHICKYVYNPDLTFLVTPMKDDDDQYNN